MLQLYPALRSVAASDVYAGLSAGWGDRRVAMNVVTTLDGRAALGGKSAGMGSRTDHLLLRHIRSHFDAVLTGAGTLLSEGIDPGLPEHLAAERRACGLPAHPLSVLLGGREGVRLRGRLAVLGPERVVVFLPEHADATALRGAATVHVLPGERPDPAAVVRVLEERHGARRLLLEGGPRVYASFLRAGLVDELLWTLAPTLAGGGDAPHMLEGPLPEGGPRPARLLSIHADGDELYLRYRLDDPTPT